MSLNTKSLIVLALAALGAAVPHEQLTHKQRNALLPASQRIAKRDGQMCQIVGTLDTTQAVSAGASGESAGNDFSSNDSLEIYLLNADSSQGDLVWTAGDDANPINQMGQTISKDETNLNQDVHWQPYWDVSWSGCDCSYGDFTNKSTALGSEVNNSFELAGFGLSVEDAESCACAFPCDDGPHFQPGWCGAHIVQYQKPDPSKDDYTYYVELFDNHHVSIGRTAYPASGPVPFQQALELASQLPAVFEVISGGTDDAPVQFKYNGDVWDSSMTDRCSVGGYDNGSRQMDCGFSC